jgi:hypothetical protein
LIRPALAAILPAALLLAHCGPPGDPHRVVSATLKFQDSTGWVAKTLEPDAFGSRLERVIRTARSAPRDPADPEAFGDCMCESPTDSLLLDLADGRREAYVLYCSTLLRDSASGPAPARLPEVQRYQLVARWDLLRQEHCPKGYGCHDGPPPARWRDHEERWEDTAWKDSYGGFERIADEMVRMLEEREDRASEMSLRVTVEVKDGTWSVASLDSVAPDRRALAEEWIARLHAKDRKVPQIDHTLILRLTFWNVLNED